MSSSIIEEPYKFLGIKPTINAAGILTRIGGSRSPSEVFKAMEAASRDFVTIADLQAKAGKYLAEITGAEAGLPTAGGSTSILLASAACIMKGTELENYEPRGPAIWRKYAQLLPLHTEGLRTGFIVQACNRDEYDHAVNCAGGRFTEVGGKQGATVEELKDIYDPENIAAFYYTLKSNSGLSLEEYVKTAHELGSPVILDACGAPPPKDGFCPFIKTGVDLVAYSGGKEVAGPNNSGILIGKRELIKLAHLQSYPFEGVGRPGKMSRETIVGLVVALEMYVNKDDSDLYNILLAKAKLIANAIGKISGVDVRIDYITDPEGAPRIPLCAVKTNETKYGMTTTELHIELLKGIPSIMTVNEPYFLIDDYHGVFSINPQFLAEGEEDKIINKIRELRKRDSILN
jgi:L-seryl-tRNA(Ser) seleniumtransferase